MLVEGFQNLGWVKQTVNSRSVAVFIQAYSLGRVIDDLVPNKMDNNSWFEIIDEFAETLFLL